MSSLNFEPRSKLRTHQNKLASLTLIAVALAFVLFKTTFAANISLNNGQTVEYGQGISQAVACSGATNINVTPSDTFTNASGGGAFTINGFVVSNIPSSCYGKDFQINAFDNSNNSPLPLYNGASTDVLVYDDNGTFLISSSATGLSVVTNSSSQFTVTFVTPVSSSTSTYKIGIQSLPNTIPGPCWESQSCALGATGPGGGTIFYYSVSAFTETGAACASSCHYLEWAPVSWATTLSINANFNTPGTSTADPLMNWSSDTTHAAQAGTYASNSAIGTGFANTQAMLTSSGSYVHDTSQAAFAVHSYAGTDSSAGQWFLGSVTEMSTAWSYDGAPNPGHFTSGWYWSSSETSAGNANSVYFTSTSTTTKATLLNQSVRPIRAF